MESGSKLSSEEVSLVSEKTPLASSDGAALFSSEASLSAEGIFDETSPEEAAARSDDSDEISDGAAGLPSQAAKIKAVARSKNRNRTNNLVRIIVTAFPSGIKVIVDRGRLSNCQRLQIAVNHQPTGNRRIGVKGVFDNIIQRAIRLGRSAQNTVEIFLQTLIICV